MHDSYTTFKSCFVTKCDKKFRYFHIFEKINFNREGSLFLTTQVYFMDT